MTTLNVNTYYQCANVSIIFQSTTFNSSKTVISHYFFISPPAHPPVHLSPASQNADNVSRRNHLSNENKSVILQRKPHRRSPVTGIAGGSADIFLEKRLSAPILDEQEISPPLAGRQTTQTSTLFCIPTSGQDVIRVPKPKSGFMTLLTPLKNEKSAQAETPAMQHSTSRPESHPSFAGLLNRSIFRPALLLILLILSSFSALAGDCKVNGIYYNLNTTDKTAEVTSGSYSGDVNIPETITYNDKTYSVTSIGENAFRGCSELSSVIIPNSVTTIDQTAFFKCSGLTSVTIPNSVTSIGYDAFYGCSGLTSLTFNAENCTEMIHPFSNCTNLTSLTIGDKVTIIPDYAFSGCSGLSSLTFNAEKCTEIKFPFKDCKKLTSLTIGDKVTIIPDNAFFRCYGLTSVTIPNSVTSIGSSAFYECTGLTSVTIGNSVTTIDKNAFVGCTGLTSVTIPNSVTTIGQTAFFKCSGLTSVTIPNSVTTIGLSAFVSCSGLTSVIFNAEKCTDMNNAFGYCTNLTSLTIGDKVTIIPRSAFEGCSGLTSLTFNAEKCTEMNNAFRDRTNLTSLTIGDKVTIIPRSAFAGCSGLTSVTIPNSVTSIDYSAFSDCSGLTSVTIGNSVTSIGSYAFNSCSKLTELVSLAVEPPSCGYKVFEEVDKTACRLTVPDESINRYKDADQWKDFMDISGTSGVDDVSVDTPDALYEVYNLQGVRVAGGMREAEITADALPHGDYILVSPQGRKKLKI